MFEVVDLFIPINLLKLFVLSVGNLIATSSLILCFDEVKGSRCSHHWKHCGALHEGIYVNIDKNLSSLKFGRLFVI